MSEHEARGVKAKIKTGDIIGLDDVIVAKNEAFDELIINMKTLTLDKPPVVSVISSSQVVTAERVAEVFGS